MKLASLYDTVSKLDALGGTSNHNNSRRIELANSMVSDLLDEYARLEAYENKYSPSLQEESEDACAIEVLRSIAQMFEAWLADARPVYESVKQLPGASQAVPRLLELRDSIGFARVRLAGTPEDLLKGVRQLRRGEGIHYNSVEELRNELRAQRRA
jgi:hypothetical protein